MAFQPVSSTPPRHHAASRGQKGLAPASLDLANRHINAQGDLFAPKADFHAAALHEVQERLKVKTWCWWEDGLLCVNLQKNILAGAALLVREVYQAPALKNFVAFKDEGTLRRFDDVVIDLNDSSQLLGVTESKHRPHIYITTALRGSGIDPRSQIQAQPLNQRDDAGEPINLTLVFKDGIPRQGKQMIGANYIVLSSSAVLELREDSFGQKFTNIALDVRRGCYSEFPHTSHPIIPKPALPAKEAYGYGLKG